MPKAKYGPEARCRVPDCNTAPIAKGLCWTHYNRERRQRARGAPVDLSKPIVPKTPGNAGKVVSTTVPQEVADAIEVAARMSPTKETAYTMTRSILMAWYKERYLPSVLASEDRDTKAK